MGGGTSPVLLGQETLASRFISGICRAGEIQRAAGVLKAGERILERQRELPRESLLPDKRNPWLRTWAR